MENQPTDSVQLPRYRCHKEVWALKIDKLRPYSHEDPDAETDGSFWLTFHDERYSPIHVDARYMRKHNPQSGGYYVQYQDGYKSFSPAEAFEAGYTLIGGSAGSCTGLPDDRRLTPPMG